VPECRGLKPALTLVSEPLPESEWPTAGPAIVSALGEFERVTVVMSMKFH
jgi:hypothetical protein